MLRKLPYAVLVLGILPTVALAVPLTGFRVTDSGNTQIVAQDGWSYGSGGLKIAWDITDNLNGTWTYRYTFTAGDGGALRNLPGHMLVELPDLDVVLQPSDLPTRADWSTQPGNSNPGLPGSILGVKLDWGSADFVEFTADRGPMWGDFYAKGGVEVIHHGHGNNEKIDRIAYNAGFGTEPTGGTTNFGPWIPVPDPPGVGPAPTVIPEPTTLALLVLGLCGVILRRKNRS
jgi:hypothetical protein